MFARMVYQLVMFHYRHGEVPPITQYMPLQMLHMTYVLDLVLFIDRALWLLEL